MIVNMWEKLDTAKLAVGVSMLVMNIASKYIVAEFDTDPERLFNNTVFRRLAIFCMFYVATRDVSHSFLLTAGFVVIAFGLFDRRSPMCLNKNKK